MTDKEIVTLWIIKRCSGFQHFVDLAGSEKAAENTGNRFKEGCAINKSLFTLGNVIRKLSGDDK